MENPAFQMRKERILPLKMKLKLTPCKLPTSQVEKINNHFISSLFSKKPETPRPFSVLYQAKLSISPHNLLKYIQQPKRPHLANFQSLTSFRSKRVSSTPLQPYRPACPQICKKDDSFNQKYSPSTHKFSHKCIGVIDLPRRSFCLTDTQENIAPISNSNKRKLNSNKPILPDLQWSISQTLVVHTNLFRKILSAIQHYKELNLNLVKFSEILKFFPGVPYGLKNGKVFMKACKNGEVDRVGILLRENQWLAHTFDYSHISALHWAVIRGHLDIVKLLIHYKAFVDVSDSVNFI